MTTEYASDTMTTTNKRVRFTDPSSEPSPILKTAGKPLTPKGLALMSVRTYASTLRKHLSPILLNAGETNINLTHSWTSKVRQLKKMEDDDEYLPRSTRNVDFEFRVTKQVEDTEEYKSINAETQIIMNDFRLSLKGKVKEVLIVEIKLIRESLIENLMKHLCLVVQAQLLTDGKKISPHLMISTFMHYHHTTFLSQTDLEIEEFNVSYKKYHSLATYPLPTSEHNPDNVEMAPEQPALHAENHSYAIQLRDDALICFKTVLATLSTPIKVYFERMDAIEVDISLKKLNSTAELEDAAATAKARLLLEPTTDPELVKDLIRCQVSSENAKLSAELGQLKKQLASLSPSKPATKKATKKTRRSQNGGASSTKKVTKNRSPSPKPRDKGRTPKVAGRDADSSKKPKGSKQKRKKPKKGQRS